MHIVIPWLVLLLAGMSANAAEAPVDGAALGAGW